MSRSRAWFPIATAGRRLRDVALDMMPNGMFAREKCDCGGMGNQDLIGILFPCYWYFFSVHQKFKQYNDYNDSGNLTLINKWYLNRQIHHSLQSAKQQPRCSPGKLRVRPVSQALAAGPNTRVQNATTNHEAIVISLSYSIQTQVPIKKSGNLVAVNQVSYPREKNMYPHGLFSNSLSLMPFPRYLYTGITPKALEETFRSRRFEGRRQIWT